MIYEHSVLKISKLSKIYLNFLPVNETVLEILSALISVLKL